MNEESWRIRFQHEDEEDALAKALEWSTLEAQKENSCSRQVTSSSQPLYENTGINDEDDEQLARAIHLSLSKVHAGVEGKIEFAQLQRSAKGTGTLIQGQRKLAIPLCLPNNWEWNSTTGKCTKKGDRRSSLYVVEDAIAQLRQIKGPVCVVSIAGTYRKGKSFVLSQAFDQPDVFPLGHSMEAKTMGIWLWVVPGKYKNSNGQEFTVVLLDSEGIDASDGKGLDDHQIFTLTVLLASVLIYNSQGVPTRRDVEGLDFIVKLAQRIHIRSHSGKASKGKDIEFFHKTFPYFIWLLRDVTQSIPTDCKDIRDYFLKKVFQEQTSSFPGDRSKQVSESILRLFPGFDAFMLPPPTVDSELMKRLTKEKDRVNPLFWSALEKFKPLIRNNLAPKHSYNHGEYVSGEGLAALVNYYVKAINTPEAIPNVQRAWDHFVTIKCSDAIKNALVTYDALLKSQISGELPCDSIIIRMSHDVAFQESENQFMAEIAGISTNTVEMKMRELKECMAQRLLSWHYENEARTKEACKEILVRLKRLHLDPVLERLKGREGAKVSFQNITNAYDKIKDDYGKKAKGAKDVIAAVFFEYHRELIQEKQQFLGLLKQLKDFDENLTRELIAKAYQDQERKRLQEQQSRLQQENHEQKREIEILIKNLDQEKKRFSEHMKSEMIAQQEQIKNMMDANMKQVQEDRKAFIEENEALKDNLREIQKRNEENANLIKQYSDLVAKTEEEMQKLREDMQNKAAKDRGAEIQKLKDRHDREMRAIREEMEKNKVKPGCGGTGFTTRAETAASLNNKIQQTYDDQEEVEKPGFFKKLLKTVGRYVIPVAGTVVSAVFPVLAPIALPVAAGLSAAAVFVSDNCSIL